MLMPKSEFLFYLLESSAGLAIFYGFYWFALRQSTFYRVNRVYLLLTTVASLTIPLISFGQSLPTQIDSPLPDVDWSQLPKVVGTVQTRMNEQPGLLDYLFWVYLIGVLVAGIRFGMHLWYLIHCIRQSDFRQYPGYQRTNTGGRLPTFSFLHYLFWNESPALSPAEGRAILQHELTHIREKHSWDILYLECLQIGLWFNPFVYLYKLALQGQHEFRADEVAASQCNPRAYRQLMIQHLFDRLPLPLVQSFHQSSLKRRLFMLRQPASARVRLAALLLLLPLTGLIAFACTDEMIPVISTIEPIDRVSAINNNSLGDVRPHVQLMDYSQGELIPLNIRRGLSVDQIPSILSIKVVPNPEYAKAYPKEARYKVVECTVSLIRAKKPVAPAIEAKTDKVDLNELKKDARPGDKIIVEVKRVLRMNAQNQIIEVNALAGASVFSVSINN